MTEEYSEAFDGFTSRWLAKHGNQYVERFDLYIPGEKEFSPYRTSEADALCDVRGFDAQPKLGPAVIYRRPLAFGDLPSAVRAYFDGNLAPGQSFRVTSFDASSVEPLSGDVFWSMIDESKLTSPEAFDALSERLAEGGDDVIFQFHKALALSLYAIDHPLNANEDRDEIENDPDEASLSLRCWAVCSGSAQYRQLLDNPGLVRWRDEMEHALQILTVAHSAWLIRHNRLVEIITKPDFSTRSNVELWGRLGLASDLTLSSRGREDDEEGMRESWYLEHPPEILQRRYRGADLLWDDAAARAWMYCCARLIVNGPSLEELLVLIAVPRRSTREQVEAQIRQGLPPQIEQHIAAMEVLETHWARPFRDAPMVAIFTIWRKSKLAMEQYLDFYGLTEV